MKRIVNSILALSLATTACSRVELADPPPQTGPDAFSTTAPHQDASHTLPSIPNADADRGADLTTETTTTDAESTPCPEGSGCLGDPCESPDDCWSGYCATHLGDEVCTKTCESDCPKGWSCKQVLTSGNDPVYICVSDAANLCRPCADANDCRSDGVEDACVSQGDDGAFCGATCSDERPCPDDFSCALVASTNGTTSLQCVPTSGECACSQTAQSLGLSTPCRITNTLGSCPGIRSCGTEGLSACDATVPAFDGCDNLDNDCDGETDEACSYRVTGFILGDGATRSANEEARLDGSLGTPRIIGSSTNGLYTVRSGLLNAGGE